MQSTSGLLWSKTSLENWSSEVPDVSYIGQWPQIWYPTLGINKKIVMSLFFLSVK